VATFYSPAEVVGAAVETEKAGRQYYLSAAETAATPAVKELFQFLAGEEAKHERTFSALYQRIKETPAELPYDWDEVLDYLKEITNTRYFLGSDKALSLARAAKNEAEALDFALEFEKATLLFYLEIPPLVAQVHRGILDELVAQERMHIRKLTALRKTV
jgi:rubrerythrin